MNPLDMLGMIPGAAGFKDQARLLISTARELTAAVDAYAGDYDDAPFIRVVRANAAFKAELAKLPPLPEGF